MSASPHWDDGVNGEHAVVSLVALCLAQAPKLRLDARSVASLPRNLLQRVFRAYVEQEALDATTIDLFGEAEVRGAPATRKRRMTLVVVCLRTIESPLRLSRRRRCGYKWTRATPRRARARFMELSTIIARYNSTGVTFSRVAIAASVRHVH